MNRYRYMCFNDTDDKIRTDLNSPDQRRRMQAVGPGIDSAIAGYTTLDQAGEYQVERSGLRTESNDVWPTRT